MAIQIQTLIDETRDLSTLRNNQFFDNDAIGAFINDAAKELYDIMVMEYEHYNVTPFDFTLTSSTQTTATASLPDDFYKSILLFRNPTQQTPQRIPMIDNFLNQPAGGLFSGTFLGSSCGLHYIISGSEIQLQPFSSAAGNYRLLYTPQCPDLWPTTTDFTVDVRTVSNIDFTILGGPGPGRSFTVTPNPGAQLVLNGVPLIGSGSEDIATLVLIMNQDDPSQNGVFRCAESDPGGTVFYRLAGYDTTAELATGTSVLVTGGTVGAGKYVQTSTQLSIDVDPLTFEAPTLPVVMNPWVVYLKTHAAITIQSARQQSTTDLQVKLAGLKERIVKAAANRTEEPTRALVIPRRTGWNRGGGYSG